jgi:hypothetical protein
MNTEKFINAVIKNIGSINSIIIHTILFTLTFLLYFVGIKFETILLTLTTIVSLEAIYLSLFIQISVNIQSKKVEDIQQNIEDIQEDIEDIQEDIEEENEDSIEN